MLPVVKSDHQLVHSKIPTRPPALSIKGKSHSLTSGPHLSIRQYNRSKSVSVAVVHSQIVKSRSSARKSTTSKSNQDTSTTTSIEMTARSRNISSPPEPPTRRQRSSSRVSFTCIGSNNRNDPGKENQEDAGKLQPPRRASVAAVPRKKSFTQFLSFFKLSRVPSVESDVEAR